MIKLKSFLLGSKVKPYQINLEYFEHDIYKISRLVLVICVFLNPSAHVSCLSNDTLYVNQNNTSNSIPKDGSTWQKAFTDLQDALNISNTFGSIEIWVAKGTYRPTRIYNIDNNDEFEIKEKTFLISKATQIYGGFTSGDSEKSQRDSLGQETILTGVLIENGLDTAYHVIVMEADSIGSDWLIDGLVIKYGKASGNTGVNRRGGGLYAYASSSTNLQIRNCLFRGNKASSGGGLYARAVKTACFQIRTSTFENNVSTSDGGGVYATANTACPQLKNSTFLNNKSGNNGGGIFVYSSAFALGTSSPQITSCYFTDNFANGSGGGVFAYAEALNTATASPVITTSIFINNSAGNGGGVSAQAETFNDIAASTDATASPIIVNSVFANNNAKNNGGGIHASAQAASFAPAAYATASPLVTNSTFSENTANHYGGGIYVSAVPIFGTVFISTVSPQITNSILWENRSDNDNDDSGRGDDIYIRQSKSSTFSQSDNSKISYSIVTSGGLFIVARDYDIDTMLVFLHENPNFVDATSGEVSLLPFSPAINRGVNDSVEYGIIKDVYGNPRIYNGVVDIGAFEAGCSSSALAFSSPHDFGIQFTEINTDSIISADNSIVPDKHVIFNGKLGVDLRDNFEIQHNAKFEIKLDGCQN